MSKRFYIGIILFCLLVSSGLFLFYHRQISSAKTGESTSRLTIKQLIPRITPSQAEVPSEDTSPTPVSTLTLLAVGDIMLDRSVMLKTEETGNYNHPFLLIDPLFKEYNLHLANLEGPITNFKSVANGTGGARFTFTFSPKFVDPLKNRFEFLSLANNHENNFGQKGIDQTRKFLGDAGVKYFGDPNNAVGLNSVTTTYNGISIAFVGYHQLVEIGLENVLAEIKKLDTQFDLVIAMPHWGVEYITDKPYPTQVEDGHAMVDAGADIIIGAHPHVVQPIEVYKDKVIFYSLGNFIFDQYFSEETQTGLAIGFQIEKGEAIKIKYTLIPLDINSVSQPSVATSPKKEKLLEHLSKFSKGITIVDGKFEVGVTAPQGFHYQLQDASYNTLKSFQNNYLVVDPDDSKLQTSQIQSLQKNGNKVLAYLSIGEAENYRDYWQKNWRVGTPAFLDEENPDWEGNFKVKYWESDWQNIILKRVDALAQQGYNGVYLDIIDAYEYYGEKGRTTASVDMVDFVAKILEQGRKINSNFLIVPQNSPELFVNEKYRNVIDGFGVEDMWYDDDTAQPKNESEEKLKFLNEALQKGKFVLSIDYPTKEKTICDYYEKCRNAGFLCVVSNRELDHKQRTICKQH